MRLPVRATNLLIFGCALSLTTSGCITIAPNAPSFSWKPFKKPSVKQASFEQQAPEVPENPKHPEKLKLAYGRLMEQAGQLDEARKNYAAVVEAEPRQVEAILGLARLDQLAGDLDQAEIGFRKAARIAPDSCLAQYSLGKFYASQQRWQESADALTKAMLADPNDTQARYALAVSLVHAGQVDAALPHFIRTVGDAEAHYNVGLILQQEGHLDEAERHFTLAVTKKPDLVAAQNWLVHVQQQRLNPTDPPEPGIPGTSDSTIVPVGHSTSQMMEDAVAPAAASEVNSLDRKLSAQQLEQKLNQHALAGS